MAVSTTAKLSSNLPVEIWDIILAQLLPESLLQLALASLSRQIYHQSLRTYLFKLGNPDPESRLTIITYYWPQFRYDALRALELPFVVNSVGHLRCNFANAPVGVSTHFINSVHRLQRAFSRLDFVKHVELVFERPGYQLDSWNVRDTRLASRWASSLQSLLNTIVSKGCERLEISGLGTVFTVPNPKSASPLSALWSGIIDLTQQLSLPFHRQTIRYREQGRLQHLSIDSLLLRTPGLARWFFSALSASSVANLKLSTSDFDHRFPRKRCEAVWKILPALILHLNQLELYTSGSTSSTIATVMGQISRVSRLHIYGTSPSKDSIIPQPIFTKLTYLRLNLYWLGKLFSDCHTRHFPALKTLDIHIDCCTLWLSPKALASSKAALQGLSKASDESRLLHTVTATFSDLASTIFYHPSFSALDPATLGGCMGCVSSIVMEVDEHIFKHPISEETREDRLDGWFQALCNVRSASLVEAPLLARPTDLAIRNCRELEKMIRNMPLIMRRLDTLHVAVPVN